MTGPDLPAVFTPGLVSMVTANWTSSSAGHHMHYNILQILTFSAPQAHRYKWECLEEEWGRLGDT